MALDPDFVRDLRCPRTRKPVTPLDAEALRALNERIRSGEQRDLAGEVVEDEVEGALKPDGEDYAYPVRDEIPSMLGEAALPLGTADDSGAAETERSKPVGGQPQQDG